ncbi:MAG: flagellar basal body L-ring protein FlgH [bacterium]|nr:flagellar basal body L-ring protein FlgH [bacterium]
MKIQRRLRRLTALGVAVWLALATGCAAKKAQMLPSLGEDLERLEAELDTLPPFPEPSRETGSLWTSAGIGRALFRDARAFRVNDLLTIVVQESAAGTNESATDLRRSSSSNFAAPYTFGSEALERVLETNSDSEFSGDGRTSRSTSLAGTITARVIRVMPNEDLVIAGQKTIMVNRERQQLTLIGSVRPVDINSGNRVSSAAIGDLTVRMWGTGEVDDTIRQGWFMRVMHRIWPF